MPDLPPKRVLDFLSHLQDGRKLEANTLSQAVCALRSLYRDHLARDWDIWKKIKFKFEFEELLPHVLNSPSCEKAPRSASRAALSV